MIIEVKTKTWSRESNCLFDFESTNLNTKIFKIAQNAKLTRLRNEVLLDQDIKDHKFKQEIGLSSVAFKKNDAII
jgi:hypothetical protein